VAELVQHQLIAQVNRLYFLVALRQIQRHERLNVDAATRERQDGLGLHFGGLRAGNDYRLHGDLRFHVLQLLQQQVVQIVDSVVLVLPPRVVALAQLSTVAHQFVESPCRQVLLFDVGLRLAAELFVELLVIKGAGRVRHINAELDAALAVIIHNDFLFLKQLIN
jgi:hypothetical protein